MEILINKAEAIEVLEGVRGCGGVRGGDTTPSTRSTLILVHLKPKSRVMSQCPHCWWRPPHTGAGLRGEPVKGAGQRGCQGEPVCPIPAQRWSSDSTGQGAKPRGAARAGHPGCVPLSCWGGDRVDSAGDLKNSISETRRQLRVWGFFCVFFPLKYLVAGHKSICCSREKSI